MSEFATKGAGERHARIQARAAHMGINETYISTLVEVFYSRVRDDRALGPIYTRYVTDWDAHQARMKNFWSAVALSTGTYSGRPVPTHQKLSGVTPDHFTRWLAMFKKTLLDTAPTPEAADYFIKRAERIASSLQRAMFAPLPDPA